MRWVSRLCSRFCMAARLPDLSVMAVGGAGLLLASMQYCTVYSYIGLDRHGADWLASRRRRTFNTPSQSVSDCLGILLIFLFHPQNWCWGIIFFFFTLRTDAGVLFVCTLRIGAGYLVYFYVCINVSCMVSSRSRVSFFGWEWQLLLFHLGNF